MHLMLMLLQPIKSLARINKYMPRCFIIPYFRLKSFRHILLQQHGQLFHFYLQSPRQSLSTPPVHVMTHAGLAKYVTNSKFVLCLHREQSLKSINHLNLALNLALRQLALRIWAQTTEPYS